MTIMVGHPRIYAAGDIADLYVRTFESLVGHVKVTDNVATQFPDKSISAFVSVNGAGVRPAFIQELKRRGIKTAVILLDEPYEVKFSKQFTYSFEHVYTNDSVSLAEHPGSRLLRLAYHPEVHWGKPADLRRVDLLFLGASFSHRRRILAPIRSFLQTINSVMVGNGWSGWGRVSEQNVPYSKVPDYYRSTKIVLNVFRDPKYSCRGNSNPDGLIPTHLNPRCFEATACGALVLTDYRADVDKFFVDECIYRSTEELKEKVAFFLANENARIAAVSKNQNMMADETYFRRAETILSDMGLRT